MLLLLTSSTPYNSQFIIVSYMSMFELPYRIERRVGQEYLKRQINKDDFLAVFIKSDIFSGSRYFATFPLIPFPLASSRSIAFFTNRIHTRLPTNIAIILSAARTASTYYVATTITTLEVKPDYRATSSVQPWMAPPYSVISLYYAENSWSVEATYEPSQENYISTTSTSCSTTSTILKEISTSLEYDVSTSTVVKEVYIYTTWSTSTTSSPKYNSSTSTSTPCTTSTSSAVKYEAVTTSTSTSTPCSTSITSAKQYYITTSSDSCSPYDTPSATAATTMHRYYNANGSAWYNCSDTTTPSLPLSYNQGAGLNSLLQLIINVPESILEAGESDVSSFFTNISTCLSNDASNIESDLNNLIPSIASFAKDAEAEISNGVADVGNFLKGIFGKRNLLSDIGNVGACIAASANKNPVFEVADCAVNIAEAVVPAAKLLKIRSDIEKAGGVESILKALGGAANVKTVGGEFLSVLKEATNFSGVVKACSFL
jgi:hypothetical protein